MPTYKAPVNDTVFLLNDVFDYARYANAPGFAEAPLDVVEAVLSEGAKFAEEVTQPLNRVGDVEGCKRNEDGSVATPKGFKEAYKALVEGGWVGIAGDPKYGGQGLPHFLAVLLGEYQTSANLAFAMYPGLTNGAVAAMMVHASEELKDRYLPKMTTGEWTGTMNLTEPHCGTDLGLIKTKAVPQGDGSYAITGQKIFISAGEHDLADNIVHLVLARIEGAPAGVKGISLFVVPKFLPDASGAPGERNGVVMRLDRAQDGHPRQRHRGPQLRRRQGLARRRGASRPAGDVRDDERRAPGRRGPGPVAVGGRLPERRGLRQGPPPGPLAERAGRARQAGRPPARPPRRAAHAARDPGVQRGGARPARLGRAHAGGGADLARPEGPASGRRPARPA